MRIDKGVAAARDFARMLMRSAIFVIVGALPILAWNWHCARSEAEPNTPIWLAFVFVLCWLSLLIGTFYLGFALPEYFYPSDEPDTGIAPFFSGLLLLFIMPYVLSTLSGQIKVHYIRRRHQTRVHSEADAVVIAYSIDENEETVDQGPVDKNTALKITEQRLNDYGETYETSTEALMEGHFGFRRSRNNYITIGIIGAEWGSYIWYSGEVETRILFWRLRSFEEFEFKKASREKVLESVGRFFDQDSKEFLRFFKRSGAKKI